MIKTAEHDADERGISHACTRTKNAIAYEYKLQVDKLKILNAKYGKNSVKLGAQRKRGNYFTYEWIKLGKTCLLKWLNW